MIHSVPTNIITGALGVGKTTLIKKLLSLKGADERWAVLVNEFGEVGIDGAILSGEQTNNDESGVFIREVPGGCMCCTSGLPMQIALNQLLALAKPHRLLIEPTGLGHPIEVLQTLTQAHYQPVLNVQATITLIDAKKLRDDKWRHHQTFAEQTQTADIIALSKSEHYEASDYTALNDYLSKNDKSTTPRIDLSAQALSLAHLKVPCAYNQSAKIQHQHNDHSHKRQVDDIAITPNPKIQKFENSGEGFFAFGWVCDAHKQFDFDTVGGLFEKLKVERLKAVLQTNKGSFYFNLADGKLSKGPSHYRDDSRLEFICDAREQALNASNAIEQTLELTQY